MARRTSKPVATPVDPELEEKMSQKMEKDFDGHDWYGASLDTKSDPLMDPGTGKKMVIRSFDFEINPEAEGFPDDKQELFNHHAKQIQTILWGDGLKPYEDVAPKLTIDSKRMSYRIVVVAEPRTGTVVAESPKTLNQLLKKNA
jgi:hypothetical protein